MPTQVNPGKRNRLRDIPHFEKDPRWPRFVKLLMQYQNARKAALDAGYSKTTAFAQSGSMADRVLNGLQAALWRQGMHVDRMAAKLVKLFDAREPKWNAGEKRWDYFENTTAQFNAYDRIKAVLEPAPPEKLEVDVLFGVKRDKGPETPEEWQTINQSRKALAPPGSTSGVATGILQTESPAQQETKKVVSKVRSRGNGNGAGNGHGSRGGDL